MFNYSAAWLVDDMYRDVWAKEVPTNRVVTFVASAGRAEARSFEPVKKILIVKNSENRIAPVTQ